MAYITRVRATSLIATFVLALAVPMVAFAQASLPWQPSPPQGQPPAQPMWQPQSQPTGQPHPHHHHDQGGQASAKPTGARAQDDRRLDGLATKYYDVSSKDPNAISKLRKLQHEVKEFRTGLAQSNYDASDIIKDAKKLEWRISAKRKKLEQAQAATEPAPMPAPPAPPPAPPCCKPSTVSPPVPPPPGTAPAPNPAAAAPPPSSYIPPLPQTQPMIPVPPPATR